MVRWNVLPVRQQDLVIAAQRIRQLLRQAATGSRNQYLHLGFSATRLTDRSIPPFRRCLSIPTTVQSSLDTVQSSPTLFRHPRPRSGITLAGLSSPPAFVAAGFKPAPGPRGGS